VKTKLDPRNQLTPFLALVSMTDSVLMVGTALLIVSNSNTRKPPSTINKTHRYKICPWRRNITTSHRQESSN